MKETHRLLITGDLLFVGKVGGTWSDNDARVEWQSLQRLMTEFPMTQPSGQDTTTARALIDDGAGEIDEPVPPVSERERVSPAQSQLGVLQEGARSAVSIAYDLEPAAKHLLNLVECCAPPAGHCPFARAA